MTNPTNDKNYVELLYVYIYIYNHKATSGQEAGVVGVCVCVLHIYARRPLYISCEHAHIAYCILHIAVKLNFNTSHITHAQLQLQFTILIWFVISNK